jgi:UrcA family protein
MTNTQLNDLWHGSMLVALTACMAVGLASVARAAPAEAAPSVTVRFGDLNLASAAGVATLHARVTAAAHQVCGSSGVDHRDLPAYASERACVSQAIANALRDVNDTRLASSRAARRDQG